MEEDAIREIDKERMEREIWLAVDGLPGNQPAAVRLRYKDGMTWTSEVEREALRWAEKELRI